MSEALKPRSIEQKDPLRLPLSPQVREVIERIDFKELRAIFEEIHSRYKDPDDRDHDVHFVEKEYIFALNLETDGDSGAHYDRMGTGASVIRIGGPEADLDEAETLSYLCHEEAHASARSRHISFVSEARDGRKGRTVIKDVGGYHESQEVMLSQEFILLRENSAHELINEAVTDRIGKLAFDAYLDRRVLASTQREGKSVGRDEYFYGYPLADRVLDFLVEKISDTCGVPQGVVEHALIHGAYNHISTFATAGEDDPSLQTLLRESTSTLFEILVRRAPGEPEFNIHDSQTVLSAALWAEMKRIQWSDALKRRWRAWLTASEQR